MKRQARDNHANGLSSWESRANILTMKFAKRNREPRLRHRFGGQIDSHDSVSSIRYDARILTTSATKLQHWQTIYTLCYEREPPVEPRITAHWRTLLTHNV